MSSLKPLTLHAHGSGPNPMKFGESSNDMKGPNFHKINPNGRVPALEDPNTNVTSWESMACINYLLRVYDTENKFGHREEAGEQGRVDVEKWCNWFRHYHKTKNEDAYQRYLVQAKYNFGVLEEHLSSHNGDWILPGEKPNVVDFHFEPWVRQHPVAGLPLDDRPKVKAWLDRVQSLPVLIRAYEKVKAGEEVA